MPPLLCQGETAESVNRSMTTKLLEEDEGVEEMKFSQVLRKIPNSKNYFIYSETDELCHAAPAEQQRDPDLKLCEIAITKPLTSLRLYKMPNGGLPIDDLSMTSSTFNWWEFGRHLLEGLSLLIVHGIVHGDLHSHNILIDDYNVPRIIDWGQSYRIQWATDNQLDKMVYWRRLRFRGSDNDFKYMQHAPEYYLFTAAKLGYNMDIVINELIESPRRRKYGLDLQQLLGVGEEDLRAQMQQFMTSSIYFRRAKEGGGIRFMRSQGLYKNDAWSVGYYLTSRLANVDRYYNLLSEPMYADKKAKMLEALRGLCHFNPLRRLTAMQALAIWDGPNNKVVARYGRDWI